MEIPEPSFEFYHRIPVQIRFNDVDLFGHLNNSVYIEFFDMGKLLYFKQFMGGHFEKQQSVPVVATINCTFCEPTYIDDRLEVFTAVASIGEKSLVLEQRIIDSNKNVKCIATTHMVNVDAKTGRPVPVTDEWRKAISEYEHREL